MIDMNYVYIGFLLVFTLIVINGTILYFLIKSRTAKAVNNLHYEIVQQARELKETSTLTISKE